MRFGLGWTKISSYLQTLISKEIGTIFSALQPSPPWFPYSTSIVSHVSRRLRVLILAFGLTASQTTESALSSTTLRIGVALRVRLTVCIPHRCKCGTTVDTFGTHTLSCRFSAGRIPRHSALIDVFRRGLSAAGIPSMLEPSGLDRGYGKRPDGITVYPYSRGRCHIWDVTCVNTFASSNLIRAALAAGSVAGAAEVRKIAKYAELGRRFIFQPVAVETSGAMGKSTIQFF